VDVAGEHEPVGASGAMVDEPDWELRRQRQPDDEHRESRNEPGGVLSAEINPPTTSSHWLAVIHGQPVFLTELPKNRTEKFFIHRRWQILLDAAAGHG
jgi:hypothetical protein